MGNFLKFILEGGAIEPNCHFEALKSHHTTTFKPVNVYGKFGCVWNKHPDNNNNNKTPAKNILI